MYRCSDFVAGSGKSWKCVKYMDTSDQNHANSYFLVRLLEFFRRNCTLVWAKFIPGKSG